MELLGLMSPIVVSIRGEGSFQLLYASKKLDAGRTVTAYLVYPDQTKSPVVTFTDLGDGIYAGQFSYDRQTDQIDEKYGVLVKEDGASTHFEVLQMIN